MCTYEHPEFCKILESIMKNVKAISSVLFTGEALWRHGTTQIALGQSQTFLHLSFGFLNRCAQRTTTKPPSKVRVFFLNIMALCLSFWSSEVWPIKKYWILVRNPMSWIKNIFKSYPWKMGVNPCHSEHDCTTGGHVTLHCITFCVTWLFLWPLIGQCYHFLSHDLHPINTGAARFLSHLLHCYQRVHIKNNKAGSIITGSVFS